MVVLYRECAARVGPSYSQLLVAKPECTSTLYVQFGMRVLALDVPPLWSVYFCTLLHPHRLEKEISDSQKNEPNVVVRGVLSPGAQS